MGFILYYPFGLALKQEVIAKPSPVELSGDFVALGEKNHQVEFYLSIRINPGLRKRKTSEVGLSVPSGR